MLDVAEQLETVMPTALTGTVARTVGMTISVAGFPAPVGAVAEIQRESGQPLLAEVIGFRDEMTLLHPHSDAAGVRHGNRVRLKRTTRWLRVGDGLLGRVIDANGVAVDGRFQPELQERTSFSQSPPHPCRRPRIDRPLSTGVRVIDGLLTCGKGQRLGIFSGSGVGKSVLLGMMARYTSADVIIIALIGERGREVNEFIQRDLGDGLAKSVVVVATSNEPALLRVQAASTATAIAEYYRDEGKDVLLLMDSLTRLAFAQREIGLAAGEPPTTRGYPPSVFGTLPKLLERAGRSPKGSITAFYTVLVEADDPTEPISDAVRGLLDGHVWLSRALASRAHYPAVDVLESLSRLMPEVIDKEHLEAAYTLRELLAVYRDHQDLISVGAYRQGSNKKVDLAIEMLDDFNRYLRQPVEQPSTLEESREGLQQLHRQCMKRLHAEQTSQPMAGQPNQSPIQTPAARR
ncbi:MAG: EscN/YscN/HrcN family type III secretion system ATPase [Planctomycetes bacterium RBG_13_63_9]|nr:MAG: EscN/YscN/HrcN family type III secretion system ATPase [Planctomycetes bacterium RBG_13_63_9]